MIMLDPKLAWVLEMLGYRWPTGNEDKLRSSAMVWRSFAADVEQIQVAGVHAAGNVLSENSGPAIEGFQESWKKFSGNGSGYLDDARKGAEMIAATLETAAMVITALKLAVIIQLIALAVQIIAAAAAAPFTFGASQIASAAATQLTRITVRRLLTEAAQVMVQAVLQTAKEPFVTALQKMTTDLVAQTVNQKFGAQDGYDAGRTAKAGKEGFKEGVENAGTTLGEGLRDGAASRAGRGARSGVESGSERVIDSALDRSGGGGRRSRRGRYGRRFRRRGRYGRWFRRRWRNRYARRWFRRRWSWRQHGQRRRLGRHARLRRRREPRRPIPIGRRGQPPGRRRALQLTCPRRRFDSRRDPGGGPFRHRRRAQELPAPHRHQQPELRRQPL